MKHQYDWSKLDAGWRSYMSPAGLILEAPAGMVALVPSFEKGPVRPHEDAGWNAFQNAVISQLDKCRVVDTTLFETMDKMAAEIPAEEWKKVPQYHMDYEPIDYVSPQGDVVATLSNKPPWRRGPLAAWTLVNISCHDGRLTVVMKRGRGELVMETGPDDETLWERLGSKVVDLDKAKAEVKEKSDG